MMFFLQNNTNFSFDGKNMKLLFNDKMINPMVFKITYDEFKKNKEIKYLF